MQYLGLGFRDSFKTGHSLVFLGGYTMSHSAEESEITDLPLSVLLHRIAGELEVVSNETERLQHTTEALIVYSGAEQFETLQLLDGVHQKLVEIARFLHAMADRSADEWSVPARELARQIRLRDLSDALLDSGERAGQKSTGEIELF